MGVSGRDRVACGAGTVTDHGAGRRRTNETILVATEQSLPRTVIPRSLAVKDDHLGGQRQIRPRDGQFRLGFDILEPHLLEEVVHWGEA